jgi:hypothetical protein
MPYTEPEIVCSLNKNTRFYSAAELQEDWLVRPVRGYSLEWTLTSPWWTHVVERVEDGNVFLARPYAMRHYGQALLGCERYSIRTDSTTKFVRMES